MYLRIVYDAYNKLDMIMCATGLQSKVGLRFFFFENTLTTFFFSEKCNKFSKPIFRFVLPEEFDESRPIHTHTHTKLLLL